MAHHMYMIVASMNAAGGPIVKLQYNQTLYEHNPVTWWEVMLVHNKAIKELSPADYLIIEKEHQLLGKYLNNLRGACDCSNLDKLPDCKVCDKEKLISCLGRLHSFLFHIIELAGIHFNDEETIMLSRPNITRQYEYFHIHKQAHEDVMQKLQGLADECLSLRDETNVAEIYVKFYDKISDLFEKHDRFFDVPFIASTKT
jgi:hemerythrin